MSDNYNELVKHFDRVKKELSLNELTDYDFLIWWTAQERMFEDKLKEYNNAKDCSA